MKNKHPWRIRHINSLPAAFILLVLLAACTTPATRKRMADLLAQAEAMNSGYVPMDTVRFMDEVHDFYMRHGDRDERIRANYMMGSVYRDRGDSPMALEYYLNAVELADTTSADCDFKRLSHIYGQIANLFRLQRYPQKELVALHKAYRCAEIANDTIMQIMCLDYTGSAYHLLGDFEKAMELSQEAYMQYVSIGKRNYAAASLGYSISYYLRKDSVIKAKKAIDEYVRHSGLMDKDGNMSSGREFFYYYLGQYYEKTNQLDSALYFYQRLLKHSDKIQNLENGYKGLMYVYGKLHCNDSILKYATLFADANDTANIRNSAKEVSRVQALYDYSQHQKTALEKTKENYALWMTVLIILILSIALCLLVFVYVKKQKAQSFEKLKEANRNYAAVIENYARVSRDFKRFKEDKAIFEKEKQAEMMALQQTISQYQGNEADEVYDLEQSIIRNETVRQFHKYASITKRPTYNDWDNLLKTIEDLLPEFCTIIQTKATKNMLSEKEIKTIYLVRLYFSPSEICVLLDLSSQNVTNIRSRLNIKLFGEKGAKTLVHNILHIYV